jgi:hypothetical protein
MHNLGVMGRGGKAKRSISFAFRLDKGQIALGTENHGWIA